jgi:opacity protein-like surface antigen
MRKLLLATTALVAFTASAFAADLSVAPLYKAPPAQSAFITGSGWYIGFGTDGAVAAANVSGPGLQFGNLTASGGAVGSDIGYIWGKCFLSSWCQAELDVRYANIGATNAGGSVISRWSVRGEFDVGADVLQTIGSYIPIASTNIFPSFDPSGLLPANAVKNLSATPRGYVGVVGDVSQVVGTFGSAEGQSAVFALGPTAGYRWQTLTNGVPNGGSIKVHADAVWTNRGVDVTGIFAAPGGAPIHVQSNNEMTATYMAGVNYDFGVGSR